MTQDNSPPKPMSEKSTLHYLNDQAEVKLRLEHYLQQPDLATILQNAYRLKPAEMDQAIQGLDLPLFDSTGVVSVETVTLTQLEDIARHMGLCGYEFLENAHPAAKHHFFKFMPFKHQPYLDELFAFAFQRELEAIQYNIYEFLERAELDFEKIDAIDRGEIEITLALTEHVAEAFFISAFDMIKREYILYAISKIRRFNPHRAFHRLHNLSDVDKNSIMEYLRYIIQSDQRVTAGEISFVSLVVSRLKIESFNIQQYRDKLINQPITFSDLNPLSPALVEPIRHQILGLVVDSAYSDKILADSEQALILEVAQLIMGGPYHSRDSETPSKASS